MIRRLITKISKNIFSLKSMQIFKILRNRDIHELKSNNEYQRKKLQDVLKLAFSEIDYYIRLNDTLELDYSLYKNFQKIPIMTKDVIRESLKSLSNNNYPKIDEIFSNTSGGSTGEPVKFFRTKEQGAHASANYNYALYLNEVDIFDKSADLWGAERDMHKTSTKFHLDSFLQNKIVLNTFVLSDKKIEDYINRLNKFKPKFLKAYVHSLYDISKFINKNNIKIDFRPIIHCTTGPLYPEMRAEIKRAFNNADIYSFYGSREVSAIASEVRHSTELYVLYDNVFVEILDSNNQPVKNGEEGEIVVTTLNNFYMPLIRYKIGDRGIKGDDLNFGTLKLKEVVGRTLGVIYKRDGSKIDGQFFTTLFFNKNGIKNFQLIQKSLSEMVLKIVKTNEFNQQELDQIIHRIDSELAGINIKIHFCEKIDLTSTGKIMYVYSELDI